MSHYFLIIFLFHLNYVNSAIDMDLYERRREFHGIWISNLFPKFNWNSDKLCRLRPSLGSCQKTYTIRDYERELNRHWQEEKRVHFQPYKLLVLFNSNYIQNSMQKYKF